MEDKLRIVARKLLSHRHEDAEFWYWLRPNHPLSKEDANKFLLASILDYQMRAEKAWENARRLAEDILKDPERLWHSITSMSLDEWTAKRKEYALHRFPKGHERVWTIGSRIVQYYQGDARAIWENQPVETILYRLNELRVGEQISRMIVGALIDTGQIEGQSGVKVDIHVRRVLGRILQGREFSELQPDEVTDVTHEMHPRNPWQLDRPLYLLGKTVCRASTPKCSDCYMQADCEYANCQASAS